MKFNFFKNLSILLISAFLMVACGNKEPAEEVVLKSYLSAIAEGKTKEAMEMIDYSSMPADEKAAVQEKLAALYEEMKKSHFDPKGGIKSIEITEKILSDDKKTAVLRYTTTFGDGSTKKDSENLINVSGQWKIYLD